MVNNIQKNKPVDGKKDFGKPAGKNFFPSDARGGRKRFERFKKEGARIKPEFDQKIISIRRVARVVAGGRRFSFSVAMVAGNRKGAVGVGLGKASDTALAIDKAFRDAQKNKIAVALSPEESIAHEVKGKFCGSVVIVMPAPGRGILAGSSVRDVVELAGVKNVNAKILSRSKNKLNNAKAAIEALKNLKSANQRMNTNLQMATNSEAPINK